MYLKKKCCTHKTLSPPEFNIRHSIHEASKSVDASPLSCGEKYLKQHHGFEIQFNLELTLSLNFFTDFIQHLLEHATSRTGINRRPPSTAENLNIITKADGALHVPHT